jgi:hypothetical protein
MSAGRNFLEDSIRNFRRCKRLAERAMAQLDGRQMHWQSDPEANSVVIVMKHMAGNMHSRWSEYLESDGEKPDRNRDGEFIDDFESREQLMEVWESGWRVLFETLEALDEDDLERTAPIRGEDHTVVEAILRQLGHYAYHVGQIVQLARMQVGPEAWETLSIARGKSDEYRPLTSE